MCLRVFVICNFDKAFFSPVSHIADMEVKTVTVRSKPSIQIQGLIYSPNLLAKSKR